ncbi:MAG: HupE/UreJ family protein [bacterium]
MPMVFAHVFAGDGGPGAGFMHPLTGADHLVAMFCIGVLSARIGGRAIWTVPSVFVSMMLVGGLAGMRGIDLPAPELGIAVSVLGVGALLALGDRTTAMLACVAAAFFGLYHGFAHGREMPLVSSAALYALGFVVSTAGLHVAGALTGALTLCRPTGAARLRVAGAVVGMAGVIFAARALGLSALAWRALP